MPIYGDNSPWLRALRLYNKANQMNLLDPECLTMKLTQYTDKCTAGRILVSQVTWAGAGPFNTNMNNEGKTDVGYAPINYPYNLGQSIPNLAYAYYPGGWQAYWIASKCKAPEGDMQYEEARKAWPDTFIWSNISLHLYGLPDVELRAWVRQTVRQAAPDGRNFALAILEDVPAQWREKIPIILDELASIG